MPTHMAHAARRPPNCWSAAAPLTGTRWRDDVSHIEDAAHQDDRPQNMQDARREHEPVHAVELRHALLGDDTGSTTSRFEVISHSRTNVGWCHANKLDPPYRSCKRSTRASASSRVAISPLSCASRMRSSSSENLRAGLKAVRNQVGAVHQRRGVEPLRRPGQPLAAIAKRRIGRPDERFLEREQLGGTIVSEHALQTRPRNFRRRCDDCEIR